MNILDPSQVQQDQTAAPAATGPFSQLAADEAKAAYVPLFEGPVTAPPVNANSPEQTNLTATLAALATTRSDPTQMTNFDNLKDTYIERIQNGTEDQVRKQISDMRAQAQADVYKQVQNDIMVNKADVKGITLPSAITAEANARYAGYDPNALEKSGVEQAQEMGARDPQTAALYTYLLKQGSYLDQARDNLTKLAIFQREVDKVQKSYEDEGIVGKVEDFLSSFIPSNDVTSKLGIVPGNSTSFFQTPGKNLQNEVLTLWNKPLDQFAKDLPVLIQNVKDQSGYFGENKQLEVSALQNLYGVNDSDALSFSVWTGIDIASVLPVGAAFRMARSPAKALILLGNRADAVKNTVSTLLKDAAGALRPGDVSGAQAVEDSLPSAVVPPSGSRFKPFIGINGDVSDEFEALKKATDQIASVPRLSGDQLTEAVQRAVEQARNAFKDDNIVDFKRAATETEEKVVEPTFNVSQDPETGIASINFYLGKQSGSGGYVTEVNAKASAERRGLLDYETHQNVDGQWFIKVRQNVRETGIATPELKEQDFPGIFGQFFKNPSNFVPNLFNKFRLQQTLQVSGIRDDIIKPLAKIVNKAAGSRKHLAAILDDQTKQTSPRTGKLGTWHTPTEFQSAFKRVAGRLPTEKEARAYYAIKDMSDWEWSVWDKNQYIERARRGVQTAEIDGENNIRTGRVNVTEVKNPDFDKLRVLNTEDGVHHSPGTNTAKLNQRWETGNYRVVKLENPITYGKEHVTHVMGPKPDIRIGPLERRQLGYVEGGTREYASKYFVKQAVRGEFKDGKKYYTNPITHITAPTQKRAADWAEQMEAGRRAYNDPNLSMADKRIAIEHTPIENYDKWEELVKDGTIRTDTPFETLFDRAMPEEMRLDRAKASGFENLSDPDTAGTSQYFMSKGRMYYSPRGDYIKDPSGKLAQTLNPYRVLMKSVGRAVNTAAFSDYNRMVVDEWSRVALRAGAIDMNSIGANLDPYNVFFYGVISPEFKKSEQGAFAKSLEGTREIHKRFLNVQDEVQETKELVLRRFAAWADDKTAVGDWVATQALNGLSRNPVRAVRGLVFDSFLGAFDPGQLLIQTQTAFAAVAVHPIYGTKAMGYSLVLPWLLKNRSENFLDFIANKTSTLHGLKPDEFKFMIKSLRNSKWLNVGGEMIQMDQYSRSLGGSLLGRGIEKGRQYGRLPFYWAEMFNRAVAYQIAWNVTKDEFPKLAYTSKEFITQVNVKADAFSMNMTNASRAGWQSGVWSIPTQFMAYQTRLMENILPKRWGGSPHFTGTEKGRLAIGQLLMYGGAGLPLGDFVMSYAEKMWQDTHNGQKLEPHVWRAMSKGAWDSLFFGLSGGKLDTDFASRAGIGAAWSQFYETMSNGQFASALDAFGGATGGVISTAIDTTNRVINYFKGEQSATLTRTEFELAMGDVANLVKSYSRAHQAYWIFKNGMIYDQKSGETQKVPVETALTALLGIPLRHSTERWEISEYLKDKEKWSQEVAQQLVKVRREAMYALANGDQKTAKAKYDIAAGLMQSYRDDPFMQSMITKKTTQLLGYNQDQWDSWVQKLYNETGEFPNGGAQ